VSKNTKNKFLKVSEEGHVFVFKYDKDDPTQLHITVRHLTEIDDALDTFFDKEAESIWNAKNKRFQTYSKTHTLFWFWLNEPKKEVMIISCIANEGGIYKSGDEL
jgi:hypothetical protein